MIVPQGERDSAVMLDLAKKEFMPTVPIPPREEFYHCAGCGGCFPKGWSDEEANAEAKELHDVDMASQDSGMAIVCDDCFNKMRAKGLF